MRPSILYFCLNLNYVATKCLPPLPTAIGNAYAVLSNPEKRQQYDQYGDQSAASNAPQPSSHSRHGYYRSFNRDFEADISPEELFNIFFGGRFPTGERLCLSVWLDEVLGQQRPHCMSSIDGMLKEEDQNHCQVVSNSSHVRINFMEKSNESPVGHWWWNRHVTAFLISS